MIPIKKQKQGQPQPHIHTKPQALSPQPVKWRIGKRKMENLVTFKIYFREVPCGLLVVLLTFQGERESTCPSFKP